LGILKAGGAYVPLDPDYPAERLAYMLQDTEAPVLLTQGRLKGRLPDHQARTVCLDEDWEAIGKREAVNPENHTHRLNLAYCIYTSGSTGKPKGVMVQHSGMAALHRAQILTFSVQPEHRVLQFASIGFDAFLFDVVMAFGSGAALVLREEDFSTELVECMNTNQVSIATLPPSFIAQTDLRQIPTLRNVVSAGEACHAGLADMLPEDCRFVNAYGPTESTVWASSYRFDRLAGTDGALPIGGPIVGTSLYLLDAHLCPVPIGVAGEIHIAGAGLARGYLNRADSTAEKFIANPYGEPGSRMYRTGDLGRYLPDGNIEFLGRIDHQVKIRGFRIELGEIENALLAHAQVREAVVLAREDDPGNKRLVAYVVGKAAAQTPSLTVSELRSHLGRTLPEYMVPSAWVFLDALPLNPNGKIDRKALPAPELSLDSLGIDFVAPRNSSEELLAGIWAEVLKIERVGVHDNFFALGGTSMLASRVVEKVRKARGARMQLKHLFSMPTIAELCGAYDLSGVTTKPEEIRVRRGVGPESAP
ncbi:MAG: non-ribosomal peptide synthetase, partial [bacterium]